MECSRGECGRRIGEIKRWVRRMSKLTEVFWESVPKSWCRIGKGAVATCRTCYRGLSMIYSLPVKLQFIQLCIKRLLFMLLINKCISLRLELPPPPVDTDNK